MKEYYRLLPYLKKYSLRYAAGLVCLLATDAVQIYIPQLTRQAVDLVADREYAAGAVLKIVIEMAVLAVLVAAGRFGWRIFIIGTARRIENGLRDGLFRHLMKLSPSFYSGNRVGEIMARFSNDMDSIRMACGMAVVSLVDGVFMTAFILAVLFSRYAGIAWMIILPLPVLAVLVLGFGKLLGRRSRRMQEGFSAVSAQAQETIAGVRVYKALAGEEYAVRRFSDVSGDYMDRSMALIRVWGLLFPMISLLAGLTTLLLLLFGGRAVIAGSLTPGEFAAVLSYLALLIWPMIGAGFTVNWLERGAASLARVGEFLDAEPEIKEAPDAVPGPVSGDIEVRNLVFGWSSGGDESPVLDGLSFSVPCGSILGILGRTGSGKTALAGLFPRLYDPPSGTVFIGGRDVRDYRLEDLRRSVGLVTQDAFLFSDSIRNNIAFGADDASIDKIREAAEFSNISRDIESFPFGWDTMVGERGHSLSGGQKQRVAISRAYLVSPEILIFDDCLSAVDADTESGILKRFLEKRKGRTSVIISNRTGTLSFADKIVVLDGGRIVQSGTHGELVESEGFFRTIYRLQQAEHGAG